MAGTGLLLQAGAARRDFAALLEVARDDALQLAGDKTTGQHRANLVARVRSLLGVLPLTARAYLQDGGNTEQRALACVITARHAMVKEQWVRVTSALSVLCKAFPLSLAGFRSSDAPPEAVVAAGRTYAKSCAMCHRYPRVGMHPFAPDLFRWARTMDSRQFVARMIDGVHGTAFTSFENPMGRAQIAALYAYLKHYRPQAAGQTSTPVR